MILFLTGAFVGACVGFLFFSLIAAASEYRGKGGKK